MLENREHATVYGCQDILHGVVNMASNMHSNPSERD